MSGSRRYNQVAPRTRQFRLVAGSNVWSLAGHACPPCRRKRRHKRGWKTREEEKARARARLIASHGQPPANRRHQNGCHAAHGSAPRRVFSTSGWFPAAASRVHTWKLATENKSTLAELWEEREGKGVMGEGQVAFRGLSPLAFVPPESVITGVPCVNALPFVVLLGPGREKKGATVRGVSILQAARARCKITARQC